MAAALRIVHLYGPGRTLKEVKSSIEKNSSQLKVSKDPNQFHIFFYTSDKTSLSLNHLAEFDWAQCSGCDRCSSAAPKRTAKRYALYPPMALLPTNTSEADSQRMALDIVNEHPEITHVAINSPVKIGDPVRRPQIVPVIGDFGKYDDTPPSRNSLDTAFWATCTQNGIFQTWAPLYTMFSRGNITEKKRVLTEFKNQEVIEGTDVVDLYAGIGYFTLAYAKQRPKRVLCWEINPWSIEGLVKATKSNGFNSRVVQENEEYVPSSEDLIVIFAEDNQNALKRLAQLSINNLSHINMGLLPHAYDAIPVALGLCKQDPHSRPVVHLHHNIRPDDLDAWKARFSSEIGECLHVEKIKQYSPGVQHICGDFRYKGNK